MLDQDALDMQQVQAGRLDRFARLVQRHQSAMFRYAQSKLRSRVLAEDAVQEAFLAAFEARQTYDPTFGFRGWIWTILMNKCRRIGKQQNRVGLQLADRDLAADNDHVGSAIERDEVRRQLAELLDQLPAEQADALRMRFFGELTYDEIGQVMMCSPATAKSRVRYGLSKLAGWLGAREEISA